MKLRRGTWSQRWYWLRRDIEVLTERLAPSAGTGYPVRREFGGWAVRPLRGWRRWRWITPPMYYTRAIPASDENAALDWGMERLGI
ncbi:hypothetical protein ACIBG0_16065 [Nocardia sp. NPDC050630]|uniref:hypothetical protein n=1 Tax=Nocardia sp. NPDC050630 TaxID=3364321 RepID=UPI0037AD61D6